MRNPKSDLEAAVQRFVDLYDFAPIAYISFDRAGRIEEANLAATELLGVPRDLLIGRPFAFYVAELDSFLRHLLYCRTTHEQVATELELKRRKGERTAVQLLVRQLLRPREMALCSTKPPSSIYLSASVTNNNWPSRRGCSI